VAFEVATALAAPLDVIVVRKLGVPAQPELAMGAIGEEEVLVLNREVVATLGIRRDELEAAVEQERLELERSRRLYRGERPPVPVTGRTVILIDDGIATGSTAAAAARVLRERGAARVMLAVPVGPPDATARFGSEIDEVVCLEAPKWFFAVGSCYEHFGQIDDEDVRRLLERAGPTPPPGPEPP
jgi:predicted phosphoribosyltransferase